MSNSIQPKKSHDSNTAAETTPINERTPSILNKIKKHHYKFIPRGDVFRIFEAVEDEQIKEFEEYLLKYSNIPKKILTIRNITKRSMLHIACQRGSIAILDRLLEEMNKHKIKALTFDVNGDSPLDLACIRGFDVHEHEDYLDHNYYPQKPENQKAKRTSKRYQVVKRLLQFKDWTGKIVFDITKETCRKKMNTPLHWAIYWTDLDLAELVFCEFPGQIFYPNKDDMIPFDMCYQTQTKFLEKKSMIILYYLLDDIFYWLKKNGVKQDFGPTEMNKKPKKVKRREKIKDEFEKLLTEIQCRKMIKRILNNDTEEDYLRLKDEYGQSELEIIDHDKKVNMTKYGKIPRYVQRIALWYGFFKKENKFLKLMKQFHISPFAKSSFGRSTIHMLCLEGHHDFLELIIQPNYKFWMNEDNRTFDLKEAISVKSGYNINTPLHHSAMRDYWKCFKILYESGADMEAFNFRGWTPLQLASHNNKYFNELRRQLKEQELEDTVKCDPIQAVECSEKKLTLHNSKYHYCIVSVADSPNPYETTVYKQLEAIQEEWEHKGKLKIEYVPGYSNNTDLISEIGIYSDVKDSNIISHGQFFESLIKGENSSIKDKKGKEHQNLNHKQLDKLLAENHYIYKLKLDKKLAGAIAQELNIRVYNQRYRYHTNFIQSDEKYYEPFRDIQKQAMIVYILYKEFNLYRFTKQKLILEHFPLHHFRYRDYIDVYWKKYFWNTILGSFILRKKDNRSLRSITQIAFYHGIQHGFYFGFLIQLTSYMGPLAFLGLFFYIYGLLSDDVYDNVFSPWVAIVISMWLTLFIENWKRKEKVLAYNFDVLGVTQDEKVRFEYTGNYVVDTTTKRVAKYDKFTAFKKRLLVDFPLFILGLLFVGSSFFLFDNITSRILDAENKKEISQNTSLIYQTITGSINGACVVLLNTVYSWLVDMVVEWENHMHERTKRNSKIMKNMFFQFFSAYFNLLIYAFVQLSYEKVATQMASMMITKNLINILTTNILPFTIYKWKVRKFNKKWKIYRRKMKNNFMKSHGIAGIETVEELKTMSVIDQTRGHENKFDASDQKIKIYPNYVNFEKKLVSMEQIERTRLMIDFGLKIDDYFMNLAIQYGYIGMFMSVFPGAAVWGFIANVVIVMFTAKAYSKIARRSLNIEQESIGVWKDIFMALSFISTIVNAMIIAFTSKAMDEIYGINDKVKALGIVILGEHIIIIFKYLLSELIPDIPSQISKRTKNEKYLEHKAKQNIAQKRTRKQGSTHLTKIFNNKNKDKLMNLFKEKQLIKDGTSDPLEEFKKVINSPQMMEIVNMAIKEDRKQQSKQNLIHSDNESEQASYDTDVHYSSDEEQELHIQEEEQQNVSIDLHKGRIDRLMAEPVEKKDKQLSKESSQSKLGLREDLELQATFHGGDRYKSRKKFNYDKEKTE